MKKFVAGVLLAGTCLTARAEFFTGNDLLNLMRGSTADKIQAIGYVQGVFDAFSNVIVCSPGNVTAGQVNDMVRNHLENNPQTRNKTADIIIMDALKPVWPCKNNNSRSRI